MWNAIIFVIDCFYLYGVNFDDVLEKKKKKNESTRKGVVYWVLPVPVFNSND